MADIGAQTWNSLGGVMAGQIITQGAAPQPLGGGASKSYFMSARDSGRVSPNDFVVWKSTVADHAGAGYAGATPTPLGSMVAGSVVVQSLR